jgi:hypothetical protein
MSIWLTIPSKRPPEETTLHLWRERGYRIALWCDGAASFTEWREHGVDLRTQQQVYPGYAIAVNLLVRLILQEHEDAEWFIAAGDDVEPDLNHTAEEIAAQCSEYFCRLHGGTVFLKNSGDGETLNIAGYPATFGVMQPTGDRWGDSPQARQRYGQERGAYIDRVCGSAWIGREFARRVNRGNGPLWPQYFHMFVDEELQEVATRLGVFWQRRDLIHLHRHWGREQGNRPANAAKMPEHLKKANDGFAESRELFNRRKATGFPGSEPL